MRFSTIPGGILDDSVSTPRGLAVKVIGVEGERLAGSEGASTQDFVRVNGRAFATPGPKQFLGSVKLVAATTDKVPGLKKAVSAALRGAERMVEAFGGESALLTATMPIENASVPWPEAASPYEAVARITATPQIAWLPARSTAVDDGMSFSPWHGVAAHRPIGSVMWVWVRVRVRVRKAAYEASARFRAEHNGRSITEPSKLDDFPV